MDIQPIPPRRIVRVVITGGSAGGKSSVLAVLCKRLDATRIPHAVVPESATAVLQAGICPAANGQIAFQYTVFHRQLRMERQKMRTLLRGTPVPSEDDLRKPFLPGLLLCDRGLADSDAYLRGTAYDTICRAAGLSAKKVFARYHTVLFLDTIATEPELLSHLSPEDGNLWRLEKDTDSLLDANARTWQAWQAHPCIHRIPVYANISEKADAAAAYLAQVLYPLYGTLLAPLASGSMQ